MMFASNNLTKLPDKICNLTFRLRLLEVTGPQPLTIVIHLIMFHVILFLPFASIYLVTTKFCKPSIFGATCIDVEKGAV